MVPSMVGALLNNIPTLWAVPLAGFIGAVTYNLSTFCASDPPSVPTFTAQDVIDLLNPYNPIPYGDAQDKFQQLVGAYAWYQVCKCDTVTTPSAPSPPSAPSGMPSINPPSVAPAYPTGVPCAQLAIHHRILASDSTYDGPNIPLPAGATTLSITAQTDVANSTFGGYTMTVYLLDSSNAVIGGAGALVNVTTNRFTQTVAVPSNAVRYRMNWGANTPSATPTSVDFDFQAFFYCGDNSGGGGSVPTPCPSDPFVLGLLEQILALVTIVQRQAAPFGYVSGTAHTGLTGRGSISVQGLLGARVEVTAFGTNTGAELADPNVLWEAGWVNWGNADGVSPRQFITNAEMLTLPALAGQYTEIHYSLEPNVTVTITELEREP